MYRVICDGTPIYDLRDESLVLIDPIVTLEVNTPGTFEFKIPPGHPHYDLLQKMRSCIEVWHDDEQIFAGRPTHESLDFYNRKSIQCEGQLAYLNDSIQRPAEYHNMTVRGYLETLIGIHNSQVDESKQFEVGIVTVKDSNDSLYRYTNYDSTWEAIKEDLIDDLGGYIRVRNHNGHRYIDYIVEFDNLCAQPIQFGENLLDFSRNIDMTDIATAVIPLGAKREESDIAALEERITIASVNNGVDCLVNVDAVEKYGFIVKTVTWDNVTTPQTLKRKGQQWLTDTQFENMIIEVKAIDLHYTDEQIEQFKLFDMVPIHSTPHGLNRNFPLTQMTVNLNRPSANTFVFGTTVKTSLTSKQSEAQAAINQAIEKIPIPSTIVQQAIAEATALIIAATHGYVVTTANEQLIMDTNDINTATRVWRWNLNGFGYSSSGYDGPYQPAITMDGWIVGDRIAANSVSSEKLSVECKTEFREAINQAQEDANEYTDQRETEVKKIITTEIKSLEDQIQLAVTDQKSIINCYDYVTNGDNQNLESDAFILSENATMAKEQAKNVNALHVIKSDAQVVTFQQNLGELPSGNYEVELKIYLPSGKKPSYCNYGLNGATQRQNFSELVTDKWHTLKTAMKLIGTGERSFYFSIYGDAGNEVFLTDIRVLRNVTEMLDDVDARITIESGKITQKVTEIYEAQQHDYCEDGVFLSDFSDQYSDHWYRSDVSRVSKVTWKDKNCINIDLTGIEDTGIYLRTRNTIPVSKQEKFIVRFKACGSVASTIKCVFGLSQYTAEGQISEEWQTIEIEFENVSVGSHHLFFYCNTAGGKVYITDVEILGCVTSYVEAGLTILKDSVETKAERDGLISLINVSPEKVVISSSKVDLSAYSTTSGVKSLIRAAEDGINLEVSKKADAVDLISQINMSPERVVISSSRVDLSDYSTTSDVESLISVTKSGIMLEVNGKVDEEDVQSVITQNADAIRMKADAIMWSSTYSSMSNDGELTCHMANFLDTTTFSSRVDFEADSNVNFLGTNIFWSAVTFKTDVTFSSTVYLKSGTGTTFRNYAYFDDNVRFRDGISVSGRSSTFGEKVTFDKDIHVSGLGEFANSSFAGDTNFWTRNAIFRYPPKVFNMNHVSSGGHVVMDTDGSTLAYLASSSKRYKDHVRDVTDEEAKTILGIPVVWFKYKKGYLNESDSLYDKPLPGFYAEDVENALKELTCYQNGNVEDWNYRTIIPLIVKVLQMHDVKIERMRIE